MPRSRVSPAGIPPASQLATFSGRDPVRFTGWKGESELGSRRLPDRNGPPHASSVPVFWGSALYTFALLCSPSVFAPQDLCVVATAWSAPAYLFLRSHMGCHDLPSDAGRRQGVPRLQRVWPRRSSGRLGDKRHLVFTCPALEHIRSRYRHLLGPRTFTMVQFLWQEDMVPVGRFVTDCFDFWRSADSPSNQP